MNRIQKFFKDNPKVALAFSGGTDSSYLLYEAAKAGADVTAYYVRSQFQPEFEYRDAVKVIEWIEEQMRKEEDSAGGVRLKVIDLDILAIEGVACNGNNRCYHCKKAIMTAVLNQIKAEQERAGEEPGNEPGRAGEEPGNEPGRAGEEPGNEPGRAGEEPGNEPGRAGEEPKAGRLCVLIDGNNASDVADDRPGMRATAELGVRSPLRELGIGKAEVRRLSEQAGIPTAHKPAYACLATRVQSGETITPEKLRVTEQAETALHEMGFRDFRIRMRDNTGIVQIRPGQDELLRSRMDIITSELSEYYDELIFETRDA